MPYLSIFGLQFEKNWRQHPQMSLIAKLVKKQKYLNLGSKMCDSGIFGLEFEKKYCHVWNQHPQICLIAKYHQIMKMTKFGTKVPCLGIFGLEFSKTTIIVEINTFKLV